MAHDADAGPRVGPWEVDRRSFLGAAAGALALPALASGQDSSRRPAPRRAKNLIFLCVDGMSVGALAIGEHVRRARDGRGSRWLGWMGEPGVHSALVMTTPASGVLTDSAAGASAWGIGRRVNNGAVCVTPEGDAPAPLFLRATHAGKRVGLVTTSYLTDASPAAMLCNAASRADRAAIAQQMIEHGLDVGVGGGARDFTDADLAGSGVRLARTWDELAGALAEDPHRRTVGLLAPGALPYAIDREPAAPTMRDLALLALGALADTPEGFCLFIENEGVDESAHANDAPALAREMIEVEDTLDALIAFAGSRDDTLLIATTDHACGNPGFSAGGAAGDAMLARLASASRSFAWMLDQFARLEPGARDARALAGLIHAATGARLDDFEVAALGRALADERVALYHGRGRLTSVMGSNLANHLGVAFTGRQHATDPALVTALGPGADALHAARHHTDLHDLITRALGLPEV